MQSAPDPAHGALDDAPPVDARRRPRGIRDRLGEIRPATAAAVGGGLAASLAVLSLAGWAELVPVAWLEGGGYPVVTPLTAVAILGLSIPLLARPGAGRPGAGRVVFVGPAIAVLIALITLAQYVLALPAGIERLLFFEALEATDARLPGRPSPHTAATVLLLGIPQLTRMHPSTRLEPLRMVLVTGGLLLPWLALFGYASSAVPFFLHPAFPKTGMSWVTALAMALIGISKLIQHRRTGLLALALSRTAGGRLIRLLLPLSVLVPLFLSAVVIRWSEMRLIPLGSGLAVSWGVTSALTTVAVFWVGYLVARGEIRERHHERARQRLVRRLEQQKAQIESLNQGLEVRVAEVTSEIRERNEELETAHLQLRSHADALERSNLELQQFAYVASHDLQTPLRSISGFLQLLERTYAGELDDRGRDWIQRSVGASVQLQTLINDLLAYSRVDTRPLPFGRVELGAVADDVIELLADLIGETGGTVTRDELPSVVGDPAQLGQVLQNLIGNGLKYRRPDAAPVVHLSAERGGDDWIVSVADRGIGIDPDQQDRIFEIFHRLHTQQEYPGTGIGLAVVRRVVHRHGGRIWVESRPGEGSRFRFTLPVSQGAA